MVSACEPTIGAPPGSAEAAVGSPTGPEKVPEVESAQTAEVRRAPPSPARVFFALWPDADTAARLEDLGRQLQARCRGRLTRLETLHLTLAFVGDVHRERIAELIAIAQQLDGPAFSLCLDELGSWARNRIAWAGTGSAPAELARLADELAIRLRVAGFPIEERPFKPHLTLLRRIAAPFATRAITPMEWRVAEFRLVESVRKPDGAHYQVLGAWRLTGSA